MPSDVEFYPDVSYFNSTDLRACSPEIVEYAMKILIHEVPMYDHSKMFKVFRQRILYSKEYKFSEKMAMLEKINNVMEELKK